MNEADNVALALVDIAPGTLVRVDSYEVPVSEPIPAGHKFAVVAIAQGAVVIKYGQPIGRATQPIAPGQYLHVHNTESQRGRGDKAPASAPSPAQEFRTKSEFPIDRGTGTPPERVRDSTTPDSLDQARVSESPAGSEPPIYRRTGTPPNMLTFPGYRRRDGRIGVRNHVLVLSTVQCASGVVERVGRAVPEVVAVTHPWGCSQIGDDLSQTRRVLEEFVQHPNVGAVLLIGLGCETMPTTEIAERAAAQGATVRRLIIQEEGGNRATLARATAIARELLEEVGRAQREPVPVSELVVGLECGGSDAWSGITANPAVGVASDLVVAAGGTCILSEVPEFIGAEHLLAARAAHPEIARQIVEACAWYEAAARQMGVDLRGAQPTPGNIAGGLTTIEEKSLGAVAKGGTSPVGEFLPYAHRPARRGLVVMDTPGNDPESVTGMVAGGAQVILFTTGRGSPTGCPIAPVIKIASNSAMFGRLRDDMDVDAGTALAGEPLSSIGWRIFDEILAVAAGKQTAAEAWGAGEFAITMVGPRV